MLHQIQVKPEKTKTLISWPNNEVLFELTHMATRSHTLRKRERESERGYATTEYGHTNII